MRCVVEPIRAACAVPAGAAINNLHVKALPPSAGTSNVLPLGAAPCTVHAQTDIHRHILATGTVAEAPPSADVLPHGAALAQSAGIGPITVGCAAAHQKRAL
jgi:hypothetical protein